MIPKWVGYLLMLVGLGAGAAAFVLAFDRPIIASLIGGGALAWIIGKYTVKNLS